jgi:hypothetical protein
MLPPLPTPDPVPLLAQAAHLPYYWHLPILIVVISLVYSATRFDEWPVILREGVRWGVRVLVFLGAIVAVLYGLAAII